MKVGLAYPAFYLDFAEFFPNLIHVVSPPKVNEFDLIIFSGGADISPRIYGEENTHSYTFPARDHIELVILQSALELNVKILGVCRGHQLINAYLGGKLVQDLGTFLAPHHAFHSLNFLTQESFIYKNIKENVNSIHHQGVISVGSGLTPTSEHKGIIESTEGENIISVQWHPEFMEDVNFFNAVKEWVCLK
jgi:putative glutamine amidotransferase